MEPGAPPRERARGLTLLSLAALLLSFAAGAGALVALALLVGCLIAHRRGYDVRRPLIAAVASLLISGVAVAACWRYVLVPAEVGPQEEGRQRRVEDGFDRAFDDAKAPPPPRSPSDTTPDAGR